MEDKVIHNNIDRLEARHKVGSGEYEYYRRDFVRRGDGRRSVVSVYELPPGKSAYPYHYHVAVEETFYIVSGRGTVRTPDGERAVRAGDMLFFPAGEVGAHKLTNTSEEPLVYIDFDTAGRLDVTFYPDSNKLGVWGSEVNKVFMLSDEAGYYEGE